MTDENIGKLIGEVAKENHVRVESDDPIFAVSTINRLMLEESVKRMGLHFQETLKQFNEAARAVDERAGRLFANEVQRSATLWRDLIRDDLTAAAKKGEELLKVAQVFTYSQMAVWGIIGVCVGLLLLIAGFTIGQYLRWR